MRQPGSLSQVITVFRSVTLPGASVRMREFRTGQNGTATFSVALWSFEWLENCPV